jgi:hypothetical protein
LAGLALPVAIKKITTKEMVNANNY